MVRVTVGRADEPVDGNAGLRSQHCIHRILPTKADLERQSAENVPAGMTALGRGGPSGGIASGPTRGFSQRGVENV
jgi:hypothetical protein